MSRYSPTVAADYFGPDPNFVADAIERERQRKRQVQQDKWSEEEHNYTVKRHATLDPLEEALLHAQMHEHGIVPSGSASPVAAGADLARGNPNVPEASRSFGDENMEGVTNPAVTGLNAPGSFNPATGTFNPPNMSRVSIGGGYDIDPSLTERGQKQGNQERMISALVARGVDPNEARVEVMGNLDSAITEHMHPGPWHPKTMADALDYEKQLIRARGEAEAEVARIREGGIRSRTEQREDLHSVERQVDDTRADLSRAEREAPKRQPLADMVPELAQRYSADSTAHAGVLNQLRQRSDSLGRVRDSLAAVVQGQPTRRHAAPPASGAGSAPTSMIRDAASKRARELQSAGKPKAEIMRIMRAEGWDVE